MINFIPMGFGENTPNRTNVVPERKELPQETLEKTRKLCADYHDQLDHTSYFDSKAVAVAGKLLVDFQAINQDNLPSSVKLVVRHRIVYLSFMASLERSPAVCAFLASLQAVTLDTTSAAGFYDSIRNDEKFKALSSADLFLVSISLDYSIQRLDPINNARAYWGKEADGHLRPIGAQGVDKRVDDEPAAKNLETGLRRVRQFVNYAKMEMSKKQ